MISENINPIVMARRARHPRWQLEYVPCNLCGADSALPLFATDSHGFGLRTVVCTLCGLIYFNPRPSGEEYRRMYHNLYEKLFPSAWLPGTAADGAAKQRLQWYGDLLKPNLRLLEIGPGKGAFLQAVKNTVAGAIVFGIEPSPDAVKACHARHLNVQHGYVDDLSGAPTMDMIAAFHVLEHELDPSALLANLWRRLVVGGHMLIEVPNILGRWKGLGMIHIAHPYQYSSHTLSALLRKASFEVVELVEMEEKGFESSLRIVARKTESCAFETRSLANKLDAPELMAKLFQERLCRWRSELTRFRLKRMALRLLGPVLARTLRAGLVKVLG